MNLKNLKEFEDELYKNLKKLKVDNANNFSHYIVDLLKSCDNVDGVEMILKSKLDCLLEKKSDEVIDIVCEYFNIRRTYGLFDGTKGELRVEVGGRKGKPTKQEYREDMEGRGKSSHHSINTGDRKDKNDRDTDSHAREDKGTHRQQRQDREKSLNKSIKHRKNKSKSVKQKLKWRDIALSVKSTNLCRKMRIPCTTYREQGFCMNGDTCKFLHGKAALVKPRLVTMNSIYGKTPTEGDSQTFYPDCSTFILPTEREEEKEQHQRQMDDYCEDAKGYLFGHSRRDKHVITLSSDDDSNSPFIPYSPPKIYTPPSILESPLWYKELGLVEEVTTSDSSSNSNNEREWKNCLIVSNIPPSMNRIGIINKHFRKFGTLRNIEVKYRGDEKKALVEFRLVKDMLTANRSVEAVMGNRFIKTRAYKKKKSKKKILKKYKRNSSRSYKGRSRSRDNYSRSRSRGSSRKHRRRSRSSRGQSQDVYEERDYKYRDKVEKKRLRSNTLESGEYARNSDDSTISSVTIRPAGETDKRSVKVVPETDRIVTIKQESECVSLTDESLLPNFPVRQEMEVEAGVSVPTTAGTTTCPLVTGDNGLASQNDSDIKLERALNDSDVDSLDSDDALGKHQRDLLIEKRKLQLRSEKQKNNATSKLKRVSDSMLHYKSILEALILEFKSCDKAKRVHLVPKIKENHARFMQLKELHTKINASKEVTTKRNKDPVEGQINELQTNLVDRLNVTQKEDVEASDSRSIFIHVPTDIVLYQDQLQAIIGDELAIATFEMSGYSNTSVLYVITMNSHSSACQALKTLTLAKDSTNWQMSLTFKD